MRTSLLLGAYAALAAVAAPSAVAVEDELETRQLGVKPLKGLLNGLGETVQGAADPFAALTSALQKVKPGSRPGSVKQAVQRLKATHSGANPLGYFGQSAALLSSGLTTGNFQAIGAGGGTFTAENSADNNNPAPPETIYPKKETGDAPYSQTEDQLRKQIFIPDDFTYGEKPPVLLIPGTGERGGNTYVGNFRKTLRNNPNADPVLLNYPGYGLADAQENAEPVAYAINYVAAITSKNISAIAWSQGNINVQWALKYWPSTRNVLANSIAFSADYHGTLDATALHPLPVGVPLPPSLIQQAYTSNYVKTARSNGGDSAYVPTTSIYSGFFDEIVEPQQGKLASAYLKDARGVGVTNIDIPSVCPPGTPAGAFANHESVLFNALSYALVVDALKNAGPARLSRIDLKDACSRFAAPGLTIRDVLITESTIPFAGYQIGVYRPKVAVEPPIKPYARR